MVRTLDGKNKGRRKEPEVEARAHWSCKMLASGESTSISTRGFQYNSRRIDYITI
jgi:hypothetical protein